MLFDYSTVTPDSVANAAARTVKAGERLVETVLTAPGDRTFDTTIAPIEEIQRLSVIAYGQASFLGQVSPDEAVRDAGRAAEERLEKWGLDLISRRDLFRKVDEYARSDEAAALTGEAGRALDRVRRDFRLAGHELDDEQRARVQELRNRLVELEVAFNMNVAEFDDGIEVSVDDLEGMPESYISRLAPGSNEGTYRISMAYPDVIPFFDNSPRRDLREALAFKFNNRAREANTPVLAEALEVRQELARIFGAESWAHHSMQVKMAKQPKAVEDFYASLVGPLTEGAANDITALEALLVADGHEAPLQTWDRAYYHTQQMKDRGVDPHVVASYFSLDDTLRGLFDITQDVFGLAYEELPDAPTWHEDVITYRMTDAASGELIGHFYMDLFPREGKFSHAAAFPLVPSATELDGDEQRPVAAIVANFTKPTADSPSLLQHDEVVTLFHEFGHILHMVLARTRYARFSGANTEWDFVEAPSQIMENWCWLPEVLQRFARHHESGEPIPADLVEQLTEARNLNISLFTLRQMLLGRIDMDLHNTLEPVDPMQVLVERSALGLLPHHEGTYHLASFAHLLGGYDAGYYGYLWSEVFGDDMFSRFADEGVLSADVGMAYRREVFEPNGTKDASELLVDFLGREPRNDAFLAKLGIAPS